MGLKGRAGFPEGEQGFQGRGEGSLRLGRQRVPGLEGGGVCTALCLFLVPLNWTLHVLKTVNFMLHAFNHIFKKVTA